MGIPNSVERPKVIQFYTRPENTVSFPTECFSPLIAAGFPYTRIKPWMTEWKKQKPEGKEREQIEVRVVIPGCFRYDPQPWKGTDNALLLLDQIGTDRSKRLIVSSSNDTLFDTISSCVKTASPGRNVYFHIDSFQRLEELIAVLSSMDPIPIEQFE